MKKFLMRLACLMLALTMVLSFVACDKDSDDKEDTKATTTEEPSKEPAEEPADNSAAAAVKAYVDQNKADAESSDETGSITLKADGTVVVFVYKYKDIDEAPAEMKEALDEALSASSMNDLLADIKSEEAAVTGVRFEYYESDGDLITSKTIK